MVKLFLAEDEIAMRESIRRNIPWEEIGIEFCGEAGDGELAWPMIRETKPDIVITDIRMPFMDGLQLTELIRKELPETQVIILSGYGEFEYAQAALRLGVSEYLLKPVTPRQLREVAGKLARKVESEKQMRREQTDFLLEERREKEANERRAFFRTLIAGGMSSHRILEMAEAAGLSLSAPLYRLLLVYVIADEGERTEGVDEILEKASVDRDGCFFFEHGMDSVAALVTGKSGEDTEQAALSLKAAIETLTEGREGLHYFISAGRTVSHLSEIHEVYRSAYRAASARFFIEPDRMIAAEMYLPQLLREKAADPIDTDRALQSGNLRGIWENFMRTGTEPEAADFVDDVFSSVGEENAQSLLFLHYLTMDCCFAMMRFLKEIGRDEEESVSRIRDISGVIDALTCVDDAKHYLTAFLIDVIRQRDSGVSGKNGDLLRKALRYIEEHYTDGSMSLQDAADAAALSPNRFSSLFSREMGMTFMEYLIGKRMDRACELLMTTEMRSFEVAYESGYNDPHYFSTTFKKYKGMSPMEYRRRGQEAGMD